MLARYLPDILLLSLGVWLAVQGRHLRASMQQVAETRESVDRLAAAVLSFARRVDALESRPVYEPSEPAKEDTADFLKRVGTLDATYCVVKGRRGILAPFGTILEGDKSSWGTLLACGPGWAEFTTGFYQLMTSTRKEQNGVLDL